MMKSEDPLQPGLEILARLLEKNYRISLLSGGEKTLTAIALIFSIFLMYLQYVYLTNDAALDDVNVEKIL